MISHLDELPSRESVYLAKHCQMKHPIVYGALIMPMGNFNFAFRSFLGLVVQFEKEENSSSGQTTQCLANHTALVII